MCVCYVVCVFLCVWCIYVCVIRVCSVCVCKTGIKREACASEQQGASAQVPLPSAHHFLDVPGAWVSLGTASSGLSAPVPLGPRLTCGFWRGRGWRGCVPCRAAASPGLRLAGGCHGAMPTSRPVPAVVAAASCVLSDPGAPEAVGRVVQLSPACSSLLRAGCPRDTVGRVNSVAV